MIYLKTRPAWAQLLMFIGMAFGLFIILSFIGVMILSKMTGIGILEIGDTDKWDFTKPGMLTFVRGMLLVQFLGLFLIPSLLFAYFSDPKPFSYVGFRSSKPIYILLGVVVLFLAIPFVEWSGVINHNLIPETTPTGKWMKESEESAAKQIAFLLQRNTAKDLLLNLVFIAGFAGFGEELFFRGVLQRIFIKMFKSPWAGIIVTAIIFSAIHLQFYGFIPRFILGVLLGLIYWYSGSLWPAILAHFIYDGFFVLLVFLDPALATQEGPTMNMGNQVVMALISAALVGTVLYLMKKKSTASYEAIYAGDKIDTGNPFSF